MNTARFYAKKIAKHAVEVNDEKLAELINGAVADSERDLNYTEQGAIHEDIELRVEEEAREAARDELRRALDDS